MEKPIVVIIGAGPAGLTAALELARDGRMQPLVLEASDTIGGISRTIVYKGNRIDIGGHRFFSKSDWVMQWWRRILPIAADTQDVEIAYQGKRRNTQGDMAAATAANGNVMLVRNRLSRIYFLRKYFDYPVKLNARTLINLGLVRIVRIGISYTWAMVFPRKQERSLEDFLINRFGNELYRTFFKDYTEKVWGVPCNEISAEWGAQRIKGLSILEALRHAFRRLVNAKDASKTKTSLIEKFLYPRLGPGQLWEEVARQVIDHGGVIHHRALVTGVVREGMKVKTVKYQTADGVIHEQAADHVISTMPIKDLVQGMHPPAPADLSKIAKELPYRDFITVGLLLRRMLPNAQSLSQSATNTPQDNWIYIQERDVRVGRLQIFNNWSPDLVADPATVWLGLEYFCQQGDDLWQKSDEEMREFAAGELAQIGMIDAADVLDGVVVRVPKTYPAYFGAYREFPRLQNWLDEIKNLWLVGRNGMHRYNNQDHSMLTAKMAVDTILAGKSDKAAIWAINIDDEYHEEANERAPESS